MTEQKLQNFTKSPGVSIQEEDDSIYDETIPLEGNETINQENKPEKKQKIRNIIGFFIIGTFNNFPYVVMMAAAKYLLKDYIGAVLLCNILPTLIVKLIAPFFMHLIPYNIRIIAVVIFAVLSFHICAFVPYPPLRLLGVISASFSAGLGEITFLALSSYYHKNTVSAWSSGTGGAGLLGTGIYLLCVNFFKLSPQLTLIIISFAPICILPTVFLLLSGAHNTNGCCSRSVYSAPVKEETEEINQVVGSPAFREVANESTASTIDQPTEREKITMKQRILHLIPLLRYMIPLFVVYLAEYTANTAIMPNLTYPNNGIFSEENDYVVLLFCYAIGVLISRSSVNIFPIKQIWLLAAVQVFIFAFLFYDAMFRIIRSLYIAMVIFIVEGLLGGACYVNAFYLLSIHSKPEYKEFNLGVTSVSDTLGIATSAVVSLFLQSFVHDHQLPFAHH